MFTNTLTNVRDFLQAELCYQFLTTPLPLVLEKEHQELAEQACDFLLAHRTRRIEGYAPRHYVIHHFGQAHDPQAKKILIAHGWMSRAAYMIQLIRVLHEQGYEVYALDFPAHGDAKGLRLPWTDAVSVLHETINAQGPFYAAIGHSFGGAMLLNTLNLASSQSPIWTLNALPERVVLMAAPTNMRTPISKIARRFKLSRPAYMQFKKAINSRLNTKANLTSGNRFAHQCSVPFLCIHGEQDTTIEPKESISFCNLYPHASLALVPDVDHVGILMDKRIGQLVNEFLQ